MLYRFAGYASIVSGLCVALGQVIHPPEVLANVTTSAWATAHQLLFVGIVVGIAGVFGVYARQYRETGSLGLAGLAGILIGMCVFLGIVFFEAFFSAAIAIGAPEFAKILYGAPPGGALAVVLMLGGLLFAVGWVAFGVATARARILSSTAAILAAIGGVLLGFNVLLPQMLVKIGAVMFGIGVAWLGYGLVKAADSRPTSAAIAR
jgi:hypothetical protein